MFVIAVAAGVWGALTGRDPDVAFVFFCVGIGIGSILR